MGARAVFDKICDRCEDNLQCYIKLGRVVGPKTPECRMARDEDDEDECSARNFERLLIKATAKITGPPNQACARAVFDKICDRCEDNLQCYIKLGRVVGPKTPECSRMARDEDDEDECSARNFERVIKATAKITGGAPNKACARAVFNKICDRCEGNLQCYIKLGTVVGPKTPACRKPAMDEIVGARSMGSSKAPTKLETEKKEVGKQAENKEEKKEENSSKPQFRTKTIVIIVSCFVSLTALFAGIAVHVLKKKKENGRCKDLRVQLQQTV